MDRLLVLFARDPGREARSKGFGSRDGADLFTAFGRGWLAAARRLDARLVVATPPDDLAAWKRRLPDPAVRWLRQRGTTFGERLEDAARRVAELGARVVFVGGDVLPDEPAARKAFESMEGGADAVLAPSPDGGVSLIALGASDRDLLGRIVAGRRDVFSTLSRALTERRRFVTVVGSSRDVDSRSDLRRLVRHRPRALARSLARQALRTGRILPPARVRAGRSILLSSPSGLRAPPLAAA